MTLFQNLILFTNHYGNLQEMLKMASFLKYVDFYFRVSGARFTWDTLYIQRTLCPTLHKFSLLPSISYQLFSYFNERTMPWRDFHCFTVLFLKNGWW
jgi:hypothetical protein